MHIIGYWLLLALVGCLAAGSSLQEEVEPVPFELPFRQVEVKLFSDLTEPALTPSSDTFIGAIPARIGEADESIRFVLQTCTQAKSLDEVMKYPFLFWVDNLGASSLLSLLMESGSFVLSGQRTPANKYVIRNGTSPLNLQANVVYVDLLGTGLSAVVHSNSSISTDIKSTAMQIFSFVQGFFAEIKQPAQNYYLAGRGYSAAAIIAYASLQMEQPPLGIILINGRVSPLAQVTTISEHFYNLGMLDLQERMKADQIGLLLQYYIRHNQTDTAYGKYQQLLAYLQASSGLELLDYYNHKATEDSSIVDQFMNQPLVQQAFGLDQYIFQSESQQIRKLYRSSFADALWALRALSARKDIRLLLLQGQTDLEYHPLAVIKWLDTLFPSSGWAEQPLSAIQYDKSQPIDGFSKQTTQGRCTFIHRSGRYLRNQPLLGQSLRWLLQ